MGSGFVSGIEAAAASALTLANNIAFRPSTTQPAKCSKLKIRIYFDSTIFQAGGNLFGRMEITSSSSQSLKLGEIAVELAAYEEITSKEFTATQSFLSSRLNFQGPNIPPSNAVSGPVDEGGFWRAKKGKTTFPFAFQLPLDCPSSLVFGQTASLRYVVTGQVQVFYHGRDETIFKSKEAFVVEAWDGYNPDYRLPVHATNSTKLFWGGSGSLVLEAMLSERLHSAGGNLAVEVKVKNNTSRKVQGIKVGVSRRLEMVSDKDKVEKNPGLKIDTVSVSEVIGTQEFKSSSYLFDTGEERTMTVNMVVPGNARTIRGTALFEVTCFVVVSMLLGAFSGELSVEIPVKICHPASLTPAPAPKLDQNHLPHQYNLVDENLDLEPNIPTGSNRRIGSTSSLSSPVTSGYDPGNSGAQTGSGRELPWSSDEGENDDGFSIGRQGEWRQDERELSPANSITSIRSILSSPKHKLSKLADKIQRSTSPSSSSHLQHDHRQGSKNTGESSALARRHMVAKSPPLGPALPIAYVPAVERVRYTPFQPPPTTKAKEFLKAAAQYQQEMGLGGALSGYGDDNVEFDLDDKKMASAIHQWISKKESEGMYRSSAPIQAPTATRPTPPIQIPIASSSRRRPAVDPIDTQIGSFSSQHSPTGASPQSYHSPASPGSPSFTNQTTSRFLHHAHRQPAAPQTEAFGSAPDDCFIDPPLFARPLPLPSPPPTGSPHRPGMNTSVQPRSLSPVPVPIQTPESLALAKEAFKRVKRVGSPVPDSTLNQAESSRDPKATPNLTGATIVEENSSASTQLLNRNVPSVTSGSTQPTDGYNAESQALAALSTSAPSLSHVPSRPLPIPGPKPLHLDPSSSSLDSTRRLAPSGHLQQPHKVAPHLTSQSNEPTTRSEQRREREQAGLKGTAKLQQSGYIPRPTPTPSSRPLPATITVSNNKPTEGGNKPSGTKRDSERKLDIKRSGQGTGSGFVYPKAVRKPIAGTKPTVAAKPKGLAAPFDTNRQDVISYQRSATGHAAEPKSQNQSQSQSQSHQELDRRLRHHQQEDRTNDHRNLTLSSTASMRAPQLIPKPPSTQSTSTPSSEENRGPAVSDTQPVHVAPGFRAASGMTAVAEEAEEDDMVAERDPKGRTHTLSLEAVHDGVMRRRSALDRPQGSPEAQTEIRAQATAAATSFRATGANSGGYLVNTGKLRQVIKDSGAQAYDHGNGSGGNGNGNGNGSGHLIQVLAGGAMSAASAAASGLGWRQQQQLGISSQSPDLQHQQQQQQRQRQQTPLEQGSKLGARSRTQQQPAEQAHDLTMKDIHFQTLVPGSNHAGPAPPTSVFGPATSHLDRPGLVSRSHHLASTSFNVEALAAKQHSRSQPGSRVMDVPPRNDPLPPVSVALAVEARSSLDSFPASTTGTVPSAAPTGPVAASTGGLTTSSSAPNLDKTLPKIQETAPRSRVFERPDKKDGERGPTGQAKMCSTSAPTSYPPLVGVYTRPEQRSRYRSDAEGETSSVFAKSGLASATPKVINPRLQEYIQKYNLAASTRP
ncbi:hypothetical protein EC968_008786 [Mortierella alpina]|nr:hypothetical protein EC968_008786 [Mortierella alpina]